ncbi:CHASE2 domain-containing protein [Anabaena sp. UHCC 0187]|uniref:CHASE2 domain-containing serine/threonine-protein kinase n=1 Tax=Anabaena sp. UHCC 0187 TaxID=2590018 RepID=UPI0014465795|nr:CHASE2 domain-containing serine/threonine-protein kinase [Anabaena sp. UHCC 0187]MTJ11314.1 CHASE2 domain-containing protein [Anabaena sp. UHCC 0187]
MAKEPISSLTKKSASVGKSGKQSQRVVGLSHLLTVTSALIAALLSVSDGVGVQWMENQVMTTWFQLRGAIAPPQDIVILAIDDQSITTPEQYYKSDPQQYGYLEPLKSFPYKREAYAHVITKLMKAGAKSVALDIVFDKPSGYGEVDDRQLQAVLQQYGNKVTLAALYENFDTHQGEFSQLTQPQEMFRSASVSIGVVNFRLEVDGKIHRLASEFIKSLSVDNPTSTKISSFAEAILASAQVKYPPPKGDRIYFSGNEGTFETISFWSVLDPENWNNYLQQGKFFQNKIVIIGATAQLIHDIHPVAMSPNQRMSGVEIHANAIASLMTNKTIAPAINNTILNGLFVLIIIGSTGLVVTKNKHGINRLLLSMAVAIVWGGISYSSFIYGQLMLPTTIPIIAITLNGIGYLGLEVIKEKNNKQQLVTIFQKYQFSPVVQEILNQQTDLQDLIEKRDSEVKGKILSGRYQIIKVLGAGGFSETYIAEDIQRPDHPQCVVKQLKPATTKEENLALARRLFSSEAKTLEKLGTHNQIPQLLAYFEEDEEFYLIQEYILGHPLNKELVSGKTFPENLVIEILKDLLQILRFVHDNGVIHRDIKPNNIIRRRSDQKLVLIDFGAVKEVSTQVTESFESTAFTIGIGTKGYSPSEQCFGRPQYNSDIYAIGMIGIKALTGISPHELKHDSNGEVIWLDYAKVSEPLAEIINHMVMDDHKLRYNSAFDALEALNKIPISQQGKIETVIDYSEDDDIDSDSVTKPWIEDE